MGEQVEDVGEEFVEGVTETVKIIEEGYGIALTEAQRELVEGVMAVAMWADLAGVKGLDLRYSFAFGKILDHLIDDVKRTIAEAHGKDWLNDWTGER